MAVYGVSDAELQSVADAIRAKAGTAEPLVWPTGYGAAIAAIQTGGGASPAAQPKDVNFYDCDGTIVASYTLAEAQALTALPDGPAHDGLVFQGWNWSLEDIKAAGREVNIGAMYITDDGKTRLHIRVGNKARSNVPLYFSQTVTKGVTIDWGDGSATETLTGTGNVHVTHAYDAAGDYTISLSVANGCALGLGYGSSSSYCVMGSTGDTGKVYCSLLRAVHMGANATSISAYAFYNCYSLTGITIPNGVTSIGDYAFRYCYSLKSVAIPNGVRSISSYTFQNCYTLKSVAIPNVTSISGYAFYNCYSLTSVIIPNGVTSIGTYTFYGCYSLTDIIIPDGVSSIGTFAFWGCCGMAKYHMKPITPPAITNDTNVFSNIPSDCIIYVPQGSLEAYQAADYWSTYASYMEEEPE